MRTFEFKNELFLPAPLEKVFEFFADAGNLEVLTPPWLSFKIVSHQPIEMRAGALIDYRLRVHGFPLRWRTRIDCWEPPFRFVDEQLRGPYRVWIHEHTFEARDNGTLARDHVRYLPPGGWLADRLFVRRDVRRIFAYRREALRRRFPARTF